MIELFYNMYKLLLFLALVISVTANNCNCTDNEASLPTSSASRSLENREPISVYGNQNIFIKALIDEVKDFLVYKIAVLTTRVDNLELTRDSARDNRACDENVEIQRTREATKNLQDELYGIKNNVSKELQIVQDEQYGFKDNISKELLHLQEEVYGIDDTVSKALQNLQDEQYGIKNNVSKELHNLQEEVYSFEDNVSKALQNLQDEQYSIKDNVSEEIHNIAFSAVLDHNVAHIGIGQTIRYNKILLNEGDCYSPVTGIFKAPVSGVYIFAYWVGRGILLDNGQVWIQLMVNGISQNAAVADQNSRSEDVQGGNVAILRLQTNDRVWVESFYARDADITGQYGFTTFSGSFLHH